MSSAIRLKRGPLHVEWEIKDFFAHTVENERLESPVFYFSDRTQWWLRIYPNGKTRSTDHIAFYLMKEFSNDEYNIDFQLGIIKSNHSVLNAVDCRHTFDKSNTGHGCLLLKSFLLACMGNVTRNSSLKVFCIMRFADNTVKENACGTDFPRSHETLTKNLQDSYMAGRLCDVTITVKDKDFHAHKYVLASRSPVFAAMFEHDMAENRSNTVNITDCDPDSFNDFLLFLYTAKLQDILPSNVFGLYETADKYDVKELREECVPLIESYLSDDTFSETVLIAVKYNESQLLMSALQYFKENTDKILDSPKWKLFMAKNSEVSSEFLAKFVKFKSDAEKK